MLWDGTSHVGSVVYYHCEEGYHTRGLRNYSVCGESGLWEDIDLWCEGATSDDHNTDKTELHIQLTYDEGLMIPLFMFDIMLSCYH